VDAAVFAAGFKDMDLSVHAANKPAFSPERKMLLFKSEYHLTMILSGPEPF